MANLVITIGRENGSGGRQLGSELAAALGVKCYDSELINETAKASGFAESFVQTHEEQRPGSFLYSLVTGGGVIADEQPFPVQIDPRQEAQRHGRRDGHRQRRQKGHHRHGALHEKRGCEDRGALLAAAYGARLCEYDRDGAVHHRLQARLPDGYGDCARRDARRDPRQDRCAPVLCRAAGDHAQRVISRQ